MKSERKIRPVAVLCSALGTILLLLVIVVCIPLTVPRMMGYQIYTVVSGSMEPAIPVGSLVYTEQVKPESVKPDEVVAFYGTRDLGAIITHRVVSNSTVTGEFITKGDANKTNDMNPVSYDQLIGRVVLSIPKLGYLAQLFTSMQGKIAAAGVILASILLHVVAGALRR